MKFLRIRERAGFLCCVNMGANETLDKRLLDLLEPLIEDMGYELLHLEMQGRSGLLRIYIDHRPPNGDAPRDITLADCERVSREVEAALDVEDPIPGSYRLEVSSPGLDRPLVKASHFRRFQGHEARVTLDLPIDGQRRFTGVIVRADDDAVELDVDGTHVQLPLADIQKARLVPEFDE